MGFNELGLMRPLNFIFMVEPVVISVLIIPEKVRVDPFNNGDIVVKVAPFPIK